MNQRRLTYGRNGRDLIALFQQHLGARGVCVGVAVNGAEWLADRNVVADLLMNDDADGWVDGIFLALAASAENDARDAYFFTLDRGHKSILATGHIDAMLRTRQACGIIDHTNVCLLYTSRCV